MTKNIFLVSFRFYGFLFDGDFFQFFLQFSAKKFRHPKKPTFTTPGREQI